jgi:hypothetical protein
MARGWHLKGTQINGNGIRWPVRAVMAILPMVKSFIIAIDRVLMVFSKFGMASIISLVLDLLITANLLD